MANRKTDASSSRGRKLAALDARMPLVPEQATQRAVWILRLLLKAGPSTRGRGPLEDPDTLAELGFDPAALSRLGPRPLRRWLEHRLQQLEGMELVQDSILQNALWVAEWLGLSETQRRLLAFATTAEASEALSVCLEPFTRLPTGRVIQVLAGVLAEPVDAVRASLAPESHLISAGVVEFRPGRDAQYQSWIGLEHPFDAVFAAHYERPEQLFSTICPRASEPALALDAFAHLSRELELLMSLLRGASRERSPGINVLLYGPPGSGKSQLVRSAAKALGLPLYHVPDSAPGGQILQGPKRLAALSTMQCLLQSGDPALVLFDEIEDAFPWSFEGGWMRQASGNDKARTNRLLEENAVPCVWVGNSIGQLDPAFVRRFSLVVEVPAPPRQVREHLLSRYSSGLEVPDELRTALADQEWIVPADAVRAARVTRLVQRGALAEDGVERGQAPATGLSDATVFERALRGGRRPEPRRNADLEYDPGLVNTSVPLEHLTRGLGQRGEGSVCLYGPPGTGKTAFARQVARALDRPLLLRSSGDLLDKWVGGTERAIADMFEEATRSESVLLLDEADGMLRSRATAVRGFEVTMVNELLVRMEQFRGVFFCATNGFEALDPASLRRFALRVEFSPLGIEQNVALLGRTATALGLELSADAVSSARRRLARLTLLTPGDYASLRRGRQLLGAASLDDLLADLERAHAEKRQATKIGFEA